MPIRTMLKRAWSMPSSRVSTRTCPTISPAVKLRMMPILPVRQNPHRIAQPTCVDRQNVFAGVSGMKTDSIRWPSSSRSRNFAVPSLDFSQRTRSGVDTRRAAARCERRSRPRSVISPKSVTPRLWTHWKSCRAWKRGCPIVSSVCSSSESSISARSWRYMAVAGRIGSSNCTPRVQPGRSRRFSADAVAHARGFTRLRSTSAACYHSILLASPSIPFYTTS